MLNIPPFAARCHLASRSTWEASFNHPFVQSLIDGTLSEERFRFYQMQDARYLEAYADVCSILSTRFSKPSEKLWFIEGAKLALVVEQELHSEYGKELGYTAQDIASLELTPNNRAYQNHMISLATRGSLLEALAALAPCPWLYSDIGIGIEEKVGVIPSEHPYGRWLATYTDPAFRTYTDEMLAFLEYEAGQHGAEYHERAMRAFDLSVRYEWLFWDQAWNGQDWSI
jgi:thiaminase/transcriptional activator TenA